MKTFEWQRTSPRKHERLKSGMESLYYFHKNCGSTHTTASSHTKYSPFYDNWQHHVRRGHWQITLWRVSTERCSTVRCGTVRHGSCFHHPKVPKMSVLCRAEPHWTTLSRAYFSVLLRWCAKQSERVPKIIPLRLTYITFTPHTLFRKLSTAVEAHSEAASRLTVKKKYTGLKVAL